MSEGYYIERGPIVLIPDPMNPNFFQVKQNPMWGQVTQICPFSEIIQWNLAEDYERVIRHCLSKHLVPLDDRSEFNLDRISRVDLDCASFHKIYFHALNRYEFRVDAVIIASYSVHYLRGRPVKEKQWYRVQGTYRLCEKSNFFESVTVYNKADIPEAKPTDKYLSRCLGMSDIDEIVEEMLSEYYPEALEKPMRVNLIYLVKQMGYSLKQARLSLDDSKLGTIVFEDTEITYYKDGKKMRGIAKKNTILIDKEAHEHLNKRTNDTIAHECSHAYIDYPFYHVQSQYRFMLGLAEMTPCDDEDDPLRWIEAHGNHMTPRLRMPLRQFGMKVGELLEKYRHLPESVLYDRLISELAEFYDSSKEMVRNRLIETGNEKVRGVGRFANGEPVPGYLVEKGIPNNQTYTLDFDKVVEEIDRNAVFRKLLEIGRYIYVEGHLCRNDDKYIWNMNEEPCLSPYARTHMRECCLLFTIRHKRQNYEYVSGTLNRTDTKRGELAYLYTTECETDEEQAEMLTEILSDIPEQFGDTMKYHMHNLDITKGNLAARSFLSEKMIMRMRNAKKTMPSLESIVAVSIGMNLYPDLSSDLLKKADRHFDPDIPVHKWYRSMLTTMYRSSMTAFNKLLAKHDFLPLKEDPDVLVEAL